MRILAVKSIPLSADTIAAWKTTDGDEHTFRFMKRGRNTNDALGMAIRNNYDIVLNLGNSGLTHLEEIVWNNKEVCDILRTPGSMRRSVMCAVLPPAPINPTQSFWLKGPGRAGWNKRFFENGGPTPTVDDPDLWDKQAHVDGEEYRVLTVGLRVVQSNRRFGPNGERNYVWVGTAETPRAVKNACRYAASLLPNHRTVIGWDVICNDLSVFILEGNTSPGVNADTARRVVDELHRQVIDGDVRDDVQLPRNLWDVTGRHGTITYTMPRGRLLTGLTVTNP